MCKTTKARLFQKEDSFVFVTCVQSPMKVFILSQQILIIKLAVEKPVTGGCINQQTGMQKSFSR